MCAKKSRLQHDTVSALNVPDPEHVPRRVAIRHNRFLRALLPSKYAVVNRSPELGSKIDRCWKGGMVCMRGYRCQLRSSHDSCWLRP
jgi:hypothetical protein